MESLAIQPFTSVTVKVYVTSTVLEVTGLGELASLRYMAGAQVKDTALQVDG